MSAPSVRPTAGSLQSDSVYNSVFWFAYAANVALVTANALTFRFAELVAWLGGTEKVSGYIISVGVMGALAARLVLGQAIDRYGTRRLWLLSASLFVAACTLFLFCGRIAWEIYAARVVFAAGIAGMFTCSIVHIQNHAPAQRRTEIIGNLGSSGFVGMIIGTQMGDTIFRLVPPGPNRFTALFGGAIGLGLLYLGIVAWLTRGDEHRRPSVTPPAHRLLFRFWPGSVVLVALMMGLSFTVMSVFLTRYTTHLGVSGIGTFWTAYAISAFIIRVSTRNWSQWIGRHRMILLGLTGYCIGQWILPFARTDLHFILPAIACGFGHALLFPAVVSLGAGAFPKRYRGTGTTLVLGFIDLGAAVFAPMIGGIIDYFDGTGFTQMFATTGGICLTVAVIYAVRTAHTLDEEIVGRRPLQVPDESASAPAACREPAVPVRGIPEGTFGR